MSIVLANEANFGQCWLMVLLAINMQSATTVYVLFGDVDIKFSVK